MRRKNFKCNQPKPPKMRIFYATMTYLSYGIVIRWLEHALCLTVVTVFAVMTFECAVCTPAENRQLNENNGLETEKRIS